MYNSRPIDDLEYTMQYDHFNWMKDSQGMTRDQKFVDVMTVVMERFLTGFVHKFDESWRDVHTAKTIERFNNLPYTGIPTKLNE